MNEKGKAEKMGVDKVAANHFYKDDGDKIKQNWFLYEYANNMHSAIEKSRELASYRKNHSTDNIVAFCIYFSKRLRQSISNMQRKQTSGVAIDARYIYEFYPSNTYTQSQRLLEAASAAWEEQIFACVNCSNQCLADGFERTDMFDTLEQTGWPT